MMADGRPGHQPSGGEAKGNFRILGRCGQSVVSFALDLIYRRLFGTGNRTGIKTGGFSG
jgi:hypothetical protein